MPRAVRSFHRGTPTHLEALIVTRTRRRGAGRVETAVITGATLVVLLIFGLMVLAMIFAADPALSAAEVRSHALAVRPGAGAPGTTVIVYGHGFFRNTVQLEWDGSVARMPTADTDRRGSFQVQLVVPTAAAGMHTISVAGSNMSTSFSVVLGAPVPGTATLRQRTP